MANDALKAALLERAKREQARRAGDRTERTFFDALKDNVIGVDDGVESPGERLGTLIRGGGAAVARGIADVPALPANLLQLGALGVEKAVGMEQPSMLSRGLASLPDTRDMLAAVPVIGPESQFRAPGTAGDFVSTIGEFAGGAGAMAGPNAMMRFGVVPGAASETAGQLTEGTAAEPYARTAAGLAAAYAASRAPGQFRTSGSNQDYRKQLGNTLEDAGVNVTKGQVTRSDRLMAAEGMLEPTGRQLDDFTSAVMRRLGSADDLATPEAMKSLRNDIVKNMDDAVDGLAIVPFAKDAKAALDVANDYVARVPQGSLTPRMRGIADEIRKLAVSKKPVSLSQIKKWRSDIGKLTLSKDQATSDAAHSLRRLIDDMTDSTLTAAGREADIAKLAAERTRYRNFIAVRDASTRAGAEGGTISPTALNQSVIRAQGRERYAVGDAPLGDLSRAGAGVLRSAPTVKAGGIRSIQNAIPAAGGLAVLGGGLTAGLSPLVSGGLAGLAAMTPMAGQAAMRSNFIQGLMRNPARALAQPIPALPGLVSAGQ